MSWNEHQFKSLVRVVRDVALIAMGIVLVLTEVIFREEGSSPDPLVLGLITLFLGFPIGSLTDRIRGDQ